MATGKSFRVTAIIAAFNEADVIAQVIADFIAQGVEVYLLDHASTDGTAAQAARFLGRGLRAIERFPDESGFPAEDAGRFAWESLLRRKEELARTLESDWFIHSDADELRESPWAGRTLSEAIREVDARGDDAIDFALFNFRPTHDRFRPGDDLRAAFPFYELPREFDVVQIKAWKKPAEGAAPIDLVSQGGHEAIFAGRRVSPVRFILRHYPIRGQAHGERKILRERRARLIDLERTQYQWHVQYDEYEPGQSLLYDPARLRRWDPDAVRSELLRAGGEAPTS